MRPCPDVELWVLAMTGVASAADGTPSAGWSRTVPPGVVAVTDTAWVRPFSSAVSVVLVPAVTTVVPGALVTEYEVAPVTDGHETVSDWSPLARAGAGRVASAMAEAIATAAGAFTSPAP